MKNAMLFLFILPSIALGQSIEETPTKVPLNVVEKYKEAGMSSKDELRRHNAEKLRLLKQRVSILSSQPIQTFGGADKKKEAIEEAKQSVKTFNDTGKDSFIRQKMPMRAPKVGDIGKLPFESFKVKQVVDADNLIVELSYQFPTEEYLAGGKTVVYRTQAIDAWLTIPGAGKTCTDGSAYQTSDVFFVAGAKQYTTVLNSSRTILNFVRVPDELLR